MGKVRSEKSTKRLKRTLQKCQIKPSEKLEPPEVALEIFSNLKNKFIPLGTLGNFGLVIGKGKSKKSFLIGLFIAIILSRNRMLSTQFRNRLPSKKRRILYFDTEQGRYHVLLALSRICKLSQIKNPKHLKVYGLRSLSPKERLELIKYAIYKNDDIGFVVIDGIKDLITSINNEGEATEIASNLLKWTEERNIHIICVLHQNKGDQNARGHLGSELTHKAETVLSVTKDSESNEISIVEPVMCRNEEPDIFAFEITEGLPALIEDYEMHSKKRKTNSILDIPDYEMFQFLNEVFSKKEMYLLTELTNNLQEVIKLRKPSIAAGDNNMRKVLEYMKEKKWLLQEAPRKPYTLGVYKEERIS